MNRMPMSRAACAVLRALIGRSRAPRDRILLTNVQSVGWQSLTFDGERHEFQLRIVGPDTSVVAERMCEGLEDAEFSIPGTIVADIAVTGAPTKALDGSVSLSIESLTVTED
jgi:hypothetical protein